MSFLITAAIAHIEKNGDITLTTSGKVAVLMLFLLLGLIAIVVALRP